jgi:tellurite resistance protein TerC
MPHESPTLFSSDQNMISTRRDQNFLEVMDGIIASVPWVRAWPKEETIDSRYDKWDVVDTTTIITVMFLLVSFDLVVAPKCQQTVQAHLMILALMVVLSALFLASVYVQRGKADTLAWVTGYIVEIALSMDNLFVFHLVFKTFHVTRSDQVMKALSIGIYGAIILRVIFILSLSALFELNYVVDIIVGLVLIASGLLTLYDDDDEDVEDLMTVRFFKWVFGTRLTEKDTRNDCRLFTEDDSGKTQITILCLVVCVISVVDVFFAVDSVGSKTGQIKNVYINLSSSLMAVFCLRALYFIIKDLNDYFAYVKYGICAILCFVGGEMVVSRWFPVPLGIMCMIIALLFVVSVIASVLKVAWVGDSDKEVANNGCMSAEAPSSAPGSLASSWK